MPARVCMGAIAGAFGVRGEVRLKSFTAEPDDIAAYGPLESEDGQQRFEITLTGRAKGALVGRLSGVHSKEAADALRGLRLFVNRSVLPATDDDEFYHTDLIGLDIYDTGGTLLGKVKAVLNHGASDLLEVDTTSGAASVLLPFTQEAVPTVDLSTGRIIADPPDGVF